MFSACWRSRFRTRENGNVRATITAPQERDLNSLSMLTAGVVLATVTMTFAAIIAVFIVRSQARMFWGHIAIPHILWTTTAILLTSSSTLETARRRLVINDQRGAFRFFVWTACLGFAFLAGQITAWVQVLHSGVVLARNPHSWFIFLFTGLHGLTSCSRLPVSSTCWCALASLPAVRSIR